MREVTERTDLHGNTVWLDGYGGMFENRECAVSSNSGKQVADVKRRQATDAVREAVHDDRVAPKAARYEQSTIDKARELNCPNAAVEMEESNAVCDAAEATRQDVTKSAKKEKSMEEIEMAKIPKTIAERLDGIEAMLNALIETQGLGGWRGMIVGDKKRLERLLDNAILKRKGQG